MDNPILMTHKLYIETLGTDVEEDLLYRLSINSLESRLNVLLFIEEKHKELKSIFQQQQHLSSFKIDSLLNEISNCFMKMKSITEKVLELKQNQKEEKKLNQIVKDSFRYDEEPKKMVILFKYKIEL